MRTLAALALLLTAAVGQEVLEVTGPTPATLRLGESAQVMLRIEGRTANPGEIQLPRVAGLELTLSAPSRSSQTFYDGRRVTERVGVQYVLELRPLTEGSFVVPPFAIHTGTKTQQTRELRLEARKDLAGNELGFLEVSVEPKRVYVHEPVRIHVECGVEAGLRLVEDVFQMQHRYLDLELQAPWLEQFPCGEPIELPKPSGELQLMVMNRTLAYAQTSVVQRTGKPWRRFVLERAFLPTRIGKFALSAPMLRSHVVTREGQRDFFGVRGRQTDNLYCYGKPVELEVLPIPEVGRPEPYFGAVGQFEFSASVDRTELKVGQTLRLTLRVAGRGNLEFLTLPEPGEIAGLHSLGKKDLPRSAREAVVVYDLTPLSADVTQIPALPWNFFDTTPGVERFVAVSSAPIELKVHPLANGESLSLPAEASKPAIVPGVDDIYDLPQLTGDPAVPDHPPTWRLVLYALVPGLLVALGQFAFAAWRKRQQDLVGARVRQARRRFEQAVAGGMEPSEALANYLADRLAVEPAAIVRPDLAQELRRAGMPEPDSTAVAQCLEQGFAARYGGHQAPALAQVRTLLQRLESLRFGARLLLPLLLWLSASLSAQQTDAVAAYRTGDYAAAEQAFARDFAASGDFRLLRAQGNCLFRQDRLPEALWAYARAALALPRDAELRANLALVRQRLGVAQPAAGLLAELQDLRERFTTSERAAFAGLCTALLVLSLLAAGRSTRARWLAALMLVPTSAGLGEVFYFGPTRAPVAIALRKVDVSSEPRAGLAALLTLQPGAEVRVLSSGGEQYLRVQVGERSGFVEKLALGIVQ